MPKRICEQCQKSCSQAEGYIGIKPEAGKPWKYPTKYLCNPCREKLGNYEAVEKFFQEHFRKLGYQGQI